jgi:hypothetical protein
MGDASDNTERREEVLCNEDAEVGRDGRWSGVRSLVLSCRARGVRRSAASSFAGDEG